MACRPHISVFDSNNRETISATIQMPGVFQAPIRQDIVHFVHYNLAKNRRQPHAVFQKAGMEHSAESWGTGRAVARIPRIAGSGTRAASQGAFGNMCRHGRMFAPLRIWRRWHRKVNLNEKRHAIASAVAASAIPSLVMARGHKIMNVPEIPLILNTINVPKTKELLKILYRFGLEEELDRVRDSRKVRSGQGKLRHHYTIKKGPLIIFDSEDNQVKRAAKNIPGLDICNVNRLNILQLCPGGHLGRMLIWTQKAFAKLGKMFGTTLSDSQTKDYHIESSVLANTDLKRIINSDEIQKVLKDPKHIARAVVQRKNPLTNKGVMKSLDPSITLKKEEQVKMEAEAKKKRQEFIKTKRQHTKSSNKSMKQLLAELDDSMKPAPKEKEEEFDSDVYEDVQNLNAADEEEVEEVKKEEVDEKGAKKDEKKKEEKKDEKAAKKEEKKKEEKKKEKGKKM